MIPEPNQPEYFLDSFPRYDFPRYVWTDRPKTLPASAWTTETTHRDGQQGGLPLTVEQSLKIYDLLCDFTGKSGAIRQAEFFVYRPGDKAALEGALERYHAGAPIEPTTWIRATAKDVALIGSLGMRETGMLASASDYHTFHKFKPGGRNQAAQTYLDAVRVTVEAGIRPRLHLEDATRAPMDFMKPFIEAVQEICAPYGDSLRPKFRVCDTMGLGLPYEEVDLPRSIPRIFRELRAMGLLPEDLEFHPHNDTWLVVANCLAAIREGCAVINGTSLGKGERTGNAPLEAVLMHLIGMGYFADEKPDFKALNGLVDLYEAMGQGVPAKYPLYGRDAHRTRAGVHADGLNKFWSLFQNTPSIAHTGFLVGPSIGSRTSISPNEGKRRFQEHLEAPFSCVKRFESSNSVQGNRKFFTDKQCLIDHLRYKIAGRLAPAPYHVKIQSKQGDEFLHGTSTKHGQQIAATFPEVGYLRASPRSN